MNGQLIRFDQIASDTGVSANTVRDHYSILVDTLLGFHLEPWRESKKRKAIATSKFYFFNIGVVHTLAGYETIDRNSNLYGTAFEHLIAQEILAYLSYSRKHLPMTFWRSQGGMEVDFLIGEKVAIEVKATTRVSEKHKKGLAALQEEKVFKKYFLVSQDPTGQTKDGIRAVFWQTFLEELWAGSIL
jgi:predicted AAA+ superfamily ATPase